MYVLALLFKILNFSLHLVKWKDLSKGQQWDLWGCENKFGVFVQQLENRHALLAVVIQIEYIFCHFNVLPFYWCITINVPES